MALHTSPVCVKSTGAKQTGNDVAADRDCNGDNGCAVLDSKKNSYGPEFAAAKGGVWAVRYDATGVLCV
jgi:hypothetical protein